MADKLTNEESRKHESNPSHIAIIMDGNGRWANNRGKPRQLGHKAGLDSVRRVIEASLNAGIKTLTLFAFSSENWRRPKTEVSFLMNLFVTAIQREAASLHQNNIRLRIVGNVAAFPEKLQKSIASIESLTQSNEGMLVQIAANYGGRWDITQAAKRLAEQVKSGDLDPSEITEDRISGWLSFGQYSGLEVPDPDLLIRTGGESRISNFLLWQSAYTELYFTDTLWPDFDGDSLNQAIADYAGRQRRFGHTGEQVSANGTVP